MRIKVNYTWYRDAYNKDTVSNFQFLECAEKSKRAVTQAIRDWAKSWTGKGYIKVSSVTTTYGDDQKFCQIAQQKFNFNN